MLKAEQIRELGKECPIGPLECGHWKHDVVDSGAALIPVVVPEKEDGARINAIREEQIVAERYRLCIVLQEVPE